MCVSLDRIETGRRLVEHEDRRPHGQHARQAHPLLLAEAQVMDWPPAERQGIDGGQRFLDAAGDLVVGQAQVSRAEGHVLLDRGGEELIGRILEDHADACDTIRPAAWPPRRCPAGGPVPVADGPAACSTFRSVVLPAPLAPITATNSPAAARNVKPSRATIPSG